MSYLFIVAIPILFILLNRVLKQNFFLLSFTGEKHQTFVGKKKIPLSLGLILFYVFSIFLIKNENYIVFYFLTLLLFLGLFSDLKIIKSPKLRFFLQAFLIVFFVYFVNLKIQSIRINEIDDLLSNNFINIFFVSFCLLVLVNGSNFIDGLNGLVLCFYLIFLLALQYLNLLSFLETKFIYFLIISIIFLLFLNLFDMAYLGDNGVYIISFFFGYLAIKSYEFNQNVSPYFYVSILYYPALENLFSILRKYKLNRSPINPDDNHLHQLIFFLIKKKMKLNNLATNNFSSMIIIFYNLVFISTSLLDIYNTKFQLLIISIYTIFYFFIYYKLFFFKFAKNFKSFSKT
jgi:UDP-N-acetylmuramyl pentapeptide phosphotransferase/UDP-N-acetylglucosamine-1-phosphate transferase